MDHLLANLSSEMFWQSESAHDEAVCVHNMWRNGPVFWIAILNTGYGGAVTDIFHSGHENTADQEHQGCNSIVELRDKTLRFWFGWIVWQADQLLEAAEDMEHGGGGGDVPDRNTILQTDKQLEILDKCGFW